MLLANVVAVLVAGNTHQSGWWNGAAEHAEIVVAVLDGAETLGVITEVIVTHGTLSDEEHGNSCLKTVRSGWSNEPSSAVMGETARSQAPVFPGRWSDWLGSSGLASETGCATLQSSY